MPTFSYEQYQALSEKLGTSFYIFHEKKVEENMRSFYESFVKRYPNVVIGYSYKTNYLPYLCNQMLRLGAYAEVVSRLEYDLALAIGQPPEQIIFNGPLKTYADLCLALDYGSIVNIDSFYELCHIQNYCLEHPNETVKVGLRVNFDLSDGSQSPLQNGYEVSRFGFCVENGNVERAIEQLKQVKNVRVAGLHGHFSTNRSLRVYQKITENLCSLAKKYFADSLEYIDVGGGMYGEIPHTFPMQDIPSFDDYAQVICEIMIREWSDSNYPQLILEPGIALVANAFQFVCQVIDVKENNGEKFVLVDGSVHNIKPTMHRYNLPIQIISSQHLSQLDLYHVVGYTCMEKDYLLHDHSGWLPALGDFIVFEHVGAYTIVFNPPFIKERPAVVVSDGEQFYLIRRKESFDDFFSKDVLQFSDLPRFQV